MLKSFPVVVYWEHVLCLNENSFLLAWYIPIWEDDLYLGENIWEIEEEWDVKLWCWRVSNFIICVLRSMPWYYYGLFYTLFIDINLLLVTSCRSSSNKWRGSCVLWTSTLLFEKCYLLDPFWPKSKIATMDHPSVQLKNLDEEDEFGWKKLYLTWNCNQLSWKDLKFVLFLF